MRNHWPHTGIFRVHYFIVCGRGDRGFWLGDVLQRRQSEDCDKTTVQDYSTLFYTQYLLLSGSGAGGSWRQVGRCWALGRWRRWRPAEWRPSLCTTQVREFAYKSEKRLCVGEAWLSCLFPCCRMVSLLFCWRIECGLPVPTVPARLLVACPYNVPLHHERTSQFGIGYWIWRSFKLCKRK